MIDQVAEGLVRYDLATNEVIPNLAESWAISTTSLVYTFSLVQNAKFHDGRQFNATAVKNSFDRLNYFLNATGTLPESVGITILAEFYEWPDGTPIINRTEIVSEFEVDVILNKIYSPFISLLAFSASYIFIPLDSDGVSELWTDYINTASDSLLGTGPFVYDGFEPGVEVNFHAFQDYWRGSANITQLKFSLINDALARNNALLSGDVDFIESPLPSMIDTFESDPDIVVDSVVGTVIQYLGMNNHLINSTWRKAISYAFDYDYIINDYWEGNAIRVNSPIPLGITYSNQTLNVATLNITHARKIMQSMGFGTGFDLYEDTEWLDAAYHAPFRILNFTYNIGNQFREDMLTMLTNQLSLIGIQVIGAGMTWSQFIYRLYEVGVLTRDMLQLYWISYGPDYNDPYHMLNALFTNRSLASNGAQYNGYLAAIEAGRDPFNVWDNVQLLLEAILSEMDPVIRTAMYNRIQQLLVEEDMPFSYGYVSINFVAYNKNIIGYQPNSLGKVIFYGVSISGVIPPPPPPPPPQTPETIHIDNNWTDAKVTGICTGTGTYEDPYIIQDLLIDCKGIGSGITIENSDVYFIIKNCTLFNSGAEYVDGGIKLYNVSHGLLINNNCSNNFNGIYLYLSHNNTISQNIVNNNTYLGIALDDSNNNSVSANLLEDNFLAGIYFFGYGNSMTGNLMSGCGLFIYPYYTENYTTEDIDSTNLIDGKPIYFYSNEVGLKSNDFLNAGQIILNNCNDSLIENFIFTNVPIGITLNDCNNLTISSNEFWQNLAGIYLYSSSGINISNNFFTNCLQLGILLDFSNYNNIQENNINNCGMGMSLGSSSYNIITSNVIQNNEYEGISIYSDSLNNLLYNNSFIANSLNARDDGYNNNWDNGINGNYWDDYDGVDANDDYIGDTPYVIPGEAGSFDNYPIWDDGPGVPISNYWILSPFVIDDDGYGDYTWAEVVMEEWCRGSGTWDDPYLIENVLMDCNGSITGIHIRNSDVYFILNNCTVYNAGEEEYYSGDGIRLDYVTNGVLLENNCSFNSYSGISLMSSSSISIINNIINENGQIGISSYNSNYTQYIGNLLRDNGLAGLYIQGRFNTFSNNLMYGSGFLIFPDSMEYYTTEEVDTSNMFNDKPIYFYSNKVSLGSDDFFNAGQVLLYNCNYSSISNLDLTGATISIYMVSCNNNLIQNNSLAGGIYGVYLWQSNYNEVNNNNITKQYYGGILLFGSNFTSIIDNNIENNTFTGISIQDSSEGLISGNTIALNEGGIQLYSATNFLIYLNNFIQNAYHAQDFGMNNNWDNGTIGNYWDDYPGVDYNDDGIGDIPYAILGEPGSVDNFPIWDDGPTVDDIEPLIVINKYDEYVLFGTGAFFIEAFITDNYQLDLPITIEFYYPNGTLINNYDMILNISDSSDTYFYYWSVGSLPVLDNYYFVIIANDTSKNSAQASEFFNIVIEIPTPDYWIVSPFVIDDTGSGDYTWEEVVNEEWCSGSGTILDPYIIEKILIDGQNLTSCITIRNSNVYFKILNSTLFNAATGYAGITLDNVTNGVIENNNIVNNIGSGIEIFFSFNNLVLNNAISNNSHMGILLYYSDATTVFQNYISSNFFGIYNWMSSYLNATGNNILNSSDTGVYIREGNYLFISNNLVANHPDGLGIFLSFCNDSTVINNHVFNNFHGIYNRGENNYIASNLLENNVNGLAAQQSYYSIHFNNTIINNERGIYVDRGTNTFYMNYLDNIIENAYEDTTQQNNWNYNFIGNYYSDYTGVDLNDDGIGDTPYLISGRAGSVDNYPIWDDGIDDYLPPTTTIVIEGTQGQDDWYISTVYITLIAIDDASGVDYTEYSYDGYMWYNYTGVINLTEDGSVMFYYRSVDNTGKIEQYSIVQLKIDRTTPTTIISVSGTPGNAGWYTSDIVITLSAVDVASGINFIEFSLNGDTWNLYTTPLIISIEGQTSIYFRSQDNAGNYEIANSTIVSIDKSAPVTSVDIEGIPVFEDWYPSNALISLFAEDNHSGVFDTQYSFDGIDWFIYEEPFNMEGLILYYYSTDIAGNLELIKTLIIKTIQFPLIIDELDPNNPSWEDIANMGLCTGSGTLSDPYIIENFTFPEEEYLIEVYNSDKHFIIRNCESIGTDMGLYFDHVENGVIENNTLTGVFMDDCEYFEIVNNRFTVEYNFIYLNNCNYTLIERNFISGENTNTALQIGSSSHNFIINNWIMNQGGIEILHDCFYNLVSNNTIVNNFDEGILLNMNCDYNIISNNTISNNLGTGIFLQGDSSDTSTGCDYNLISENIISNNDGDGILIQQGNNNIIQSNFISGNNGQGIFIIGEDQFCYYIQILDNFLMGYLGGNGIWMDSCYECLIEDNSITSFGSCGLYILRSHNLNISENSFYENSENAIYLGDSSNVIISRNLVIDHGNVGIIIQNCSECIVKGNEVLGNVEGLRLVDSTSNTIIDNNISDNNAEGIWIQRGNNNTLQNNTILNNGARGIYLIGDPEYPSAFNNISENIIENNYGTGIRIEFSQNSYISDNTMIDNEGLGITLYYCLEIEVLKNIVSDNNEAGIAVEYSNNNTISNNEINQDSPNVGIGLSHSNYNVVSNNTINGYEIGIFGIFLRDSNYNIITENEIVGNEGNGIQLENRCMYNVISNNLILDNLVTGIYMEEVCNFNSITGNIINNNHGTGIQIDTCSCTIISNNTLESNIFDGIALYNSDDSIITNNLITNGEQYGISLVLCEIIEVSENCIDYTDDFAIYLEVCSEILILNNEIRESSMAMNLWESYYCRVINNLMINSFYGDVGLYIESSSGNLISGNIIYHFGICMDIEFCNDNNISLNTISNCEMGIFLDNSWNNSIMSNNFTNITTSGITLYQSDDCYISKNIIVRGDFEDEGNGIEISHSNSNIISGNIVRDNFDSGILLANSDYNTIVGNYISNNNGDGIRLESSNLNAITNNSINTYYNAINLRFSNFNTISDNYLVRGITIEASSFNTFIGNLFNGSLGAEILDHSHDNIFSANEFYGGGISFPQIYYIRLSLEELASHIIDSTNLMNNKPIYFYVNEMGLDSDDFQNAGQIILVNCENCVISSLDLSYTTYGISLYFCGDIQVSNSIASYNIRAGIYLYYCDYNNITDNVLNYNGQFGINLRASNNNLISNNMINKTYGACGIRLAYDSNYNSIISNFVLNSDFNGIFLYNSDYNTIRNNEVKFSKGFGIEIVETSSENLGFANIIYGNIGGNAKDDGTSNKWDNGTIGNYWGDYPGVDLNDDGIGDTPYLISGTAGSQDNFPIWEDGIDDPVRYEWHSTWGLKQDIDWGNAMVLDSAGNIYIAGETMGDICLVKFDSTGVIQWNRTWGGTISEEGMGVALDSNENVYIVGFSQGYQMILLKYDSSGVLQWNLTRSGGNFFAITIDSSDNIFITGALGHDIGLWKYDTAGIEQWVRTWGGPIYGVPDLGRGITLDSSGNIYIVGETRSFGAGFYDACLLKYDSSGVLQWYRTWGENRWDRGNAISVDSYDNIYITGFTTISEINDAPDAFLVKYSRSGVQIWNRTWGGFYEDMMNAITLDSSGYIYIAGRLGISYGKSHTYLVIYDRMGVQRWNRTWGDKYYERATAIALDSSGDIYLAGSTSDFIDQYVYDILLVKYCCNLPPPPPDMSPPATAIVMSGTAGLNDWFVSEVSVALIADANSGVDYSEYSFDGTNWHLYTEPVLVTIEGETTIYYRSVDNAGHVEPTRKRILKIDYTPPVTAIELDGTLEMNEWFSSEVLVTLTTTDDTSGVYYSEFSYDGINWHLYSGPFLVSLEGEISIYYRSTDLAGNMEIAQSVIFKIITIPSNIVEEVIAILADLEVPYGAQFHIDRAIYKLSRSVTKFESGHFCIAFDYIQNALEHLMCAKIYGAEVQEVINILVTLVRGLTEDAIEDAIEMVGEDNYFVVIAIEKYDIAIQKLSNNEFDKAVEYFRIAFKNAMKARVEWVPEFFIDDLQGLIADIQELKEEEDISYIAWNYLNYAECKIQDAINMANQSFFDISFYKLGIAIYFLTRAYSYGVNTLFLIDDIMGMIDEMVELKISDAESVLIGAESESIETAWTIFHNAQDALENGDYYTAIQLYILALEKAEDALLPEWHDYDYRDHDYHY